MDREYVRAVLERAGFQAKEALAAAEALFGTEPDKPDRVQLHPDFRSGVQIQNVGDQPLVFSSPADGLGDVVSAVAPGVECSLPPIPQDAWQDLDPMNRDAIHQFAVKHKVVVITAEASSDPYLVAMLYTPSTN